MHGFFFYPLSLLLSDLIPLALDESILKYRNVTLDCFSYSLVENKRLPPGALEKGKRPSEVFGEGVDKQLPY